MRKIIANMPWAAILSFATLTFFGCSLKPGSQTSTASSTATSASVSNSPTATASNTAIATDTGTSVGTMTSTMTSVTSATLTATATRTASATATATSSNSSTATQTSVANGTIEAPGPSANLFNNPYYTCVNNYYVAANGNDANNGTSSATPWKTLQHAHDSLPTGGKAAGSCINVAPGTYADGVTMTTGGNQASSTGYVVWRCASMDACTVTDPGGAFVWNGASAANYVMVDGFTMAASSEITYGQGVEVWGNGDSNQSVHHIWILNSVISGYGQSGVQINDGEYFFVIHNKIFDNSRVTCDAQGSGVSMAFLKAFPSYQATADDLNNKIVGNLGTGFHNAINWNVLYNNALTQCGSMSSMYDTDGNNIILDTLNNNFNTFGPYTKGVLVAFNVTYNAGGGGVHTFLSENVTVANNTCYNNYLDPFNNGSDRACIDFNGSYGDTALNNIAVGIPTAATTVCYNDYGVYPNTQWGNAINAGGVTGQAANTYNNNLTYMVNTTGCAGEIGMYNNDIYICTAATGGLEYTANGSTKVSGGTNICSSNPGFVSVGTTSNGSETTQPAGTNFALQASSPAIGQGVTKSYLSPQSVDIGACYHSLTSCP